MTSNLRAKVQCRHEDAENVAVFELVAADGNPLPPFTAGAHIDVLTPTGQLRQYSLCNAPSDTGTYTIAVLREHSGRGGSRAMHEAIKVGDAIDISAPRNHFELREDARFSVLLAAGIGITPLVAMAERLHALGRDFVLHYCARAEERTALLQRLRRSAFSENVRFHFSGGETSRRLDMADVLATPQPGTEIYACGPGGFIESVQSCAAQAGWASAQVHFEHFAGKTLDASDDVAFDVVIQSTGRVIRVNTAQSIAQALDACGITIPVSCEQGVCGTCLTRVVDGEVDHRDLYLNPTEQAANDQMLPCCSRARSAQLVLDL